MEEIWADVYYGGVYVGKKISNMGRMMRDDGTECNTYNNGAGYLAYSLCTMKNSKGSWQPKLQYVHRLVAQYFLPNPLNLPQVNHKDCDKSNNVYTNLEWISRKANIDHAHASGRMKARTSLTTTKILTPEQVIECYTRVKLGEGISVVARSMDMPRTTLSSIINKRSNVAITDKLDEQLKRAKEIVDELSRQPILA